MRHNTNRITGNNRIPDNVHNRNHNKLPAFNSIRTKPGSSIPEQMGVISFSLEPITGVSTVLITIIGFSYGSGQFNKINTACHYSIRFSTII